MKNDVKVVIVFSGMPKPEKVERVKALLFRELKKPIRRLSGRGNNYGKEKSRTITPGFNRKAGGG